MWKFALLLVFAQLTYHLTLAACKSDVNAHGGCGVNCGKHCNNLLQTGPFECPRICEVDGCDCNDGYYLQDSTGQCVLPADCDICSKNRVLDLCPSDCPRRNCTVGRILVKCPTPLEVGDPNCPAPVCRCQDGLFENGDGDCVTYEQCRN